MSLSPLYVLLGEMSVQVLYPFYNWIVCFPGVESCEVFTYFGDQTLVQGIIGKYNFPYGWFHFHFVDFFLAMKKLFILMKSYLFILSSKSLVQRDILVKILLHGISEIFLCIFSSRTFKVSRLIFKSFIHLEFIFVCGVSWWLSFIFLHVVVQISQNHCQGGCFYSILCFCTLCQILIDHRDLGLFLGFLFSSVDLCVCSYVSTRLF